MRKKIFFYWTNSQTIEKLTSYVCVCWKQNNTESQIFTKKICCFVGF
jgi:hypothetical protein